MNQPNEDLGPEIYKELSFAAKEARRFAIRNYALAYLVSGVIVVASITAGLTVGIESFPKWITAALASLPAVMLTASTVFRFEQKSAWFWKKAKALDSLVRKLKYKSIDPLEASDLFSQIEEQMERDWVSFGAVGKSSG
jgi:uncharacterized membrane protein YhdT